MRTPVRMSNAKSRQLRIDRIVLLVVLVICAKLTFATQEVQPEDHFSIDKPTGDRTEENPEYTQVSLEERSSFTLSQQPEVTIKSVNNEEKHTNSKNTRYDTFGKEVSEATSATEGRYENLRRIKVTGNNPAYNIQEIDSFDNSRDTPDLKNPRNLARNGRRYQHIRRNNGGVILSEASSSEEKVFTTRKTIVRPKDEHNTAGETSNVYIDRNEEVNYSRDKHNPDKKPLTKNYELLTEKHEESSAKRGKRRKSDQQITRNGSKLDKDTTYKDISTANEPHAGLTGASKIKKGKDSHPVGKVKIVKRKQTLNNIINDSDTADEQLHRKNVDIEMPMLNSKTHKVTEMPAQVTHIQGARRLVKIKRVRRPIKITKVNDVAENKKHTRIRGHRKHNTHITQSSIVQSRRSPRSANFARTKRTIDMSEDGMLMKILRLVQQFLGDPKPKESTLRNTKTAAIRSSSHLEESKNVNRGGRKLVQTSTLVAQESSPVKLQENSLNIVRSQNQNATKSPKVNSKQEPIANEATTHTLHSEEDQIVKLLSDLEKLDTSNKQITAIKITTEGSEKSTHKSTSKEESIRGLGATSQSDNKGIQNPLSHVNPISEHKLSNKAISSSKIISDDRTPRINHANNVVLDKPKSEDENPANLSEIELLLLSLTSTEDAATTVLDTTTTEIPITTTNNADDILHSLLSSLSKESHQATTAKKEKVITEKIDNDQLTTARKKGTDQLSNTSKTSEDLEVTTNTATTTEDAAAYLQKILASFSDVTEQSLHSPIEDKTTKNMEDIILEATQQPSLLEDHTTTETPTTVSPNAATIVSRISPLTSDKAEAGPVNEKINDEEPNKKNNTETLRGNATTDNPSENENGGDELEKVFEGLLASIAIDSNKNDTSDANEGANRIGKKAKSLHVENVTGASLNLEKLIAEISTTTIPTTSNEPKNTTNKLAHTRKNNTLEESFSDLLSSLVDLSTTTSDADANSSRKNITHPRTKEGIEKVSPPTLSNNQTVTDKPINEIEKLLLDLVSNITDKQLLTTKQDPVQVKKVTTFKPPLELLFGKETVILLDPLKYFEYAEKEKPHQWKEIEIATEANVPAGPGPKKVLTLTLRKRPRGKVSSKNTTNTSKESGQKSSSREQSRQHQVDRHKHRGSPRWSAANRRRPLITSTTKKPFVYQRNKNQRFNPYLHRFRSTQVHNKTNDKTNLHETRRDHSKTTPSVNNGEKGEDSEVISILNGLLESLDQKNETNESSRTSPKSSITRGQDDVTGTIAGPNKGESNTTRIVEGNETAEKNNNNSYLKQIMHLISDNIHENEGNVTIEMFATSTTKHLEEIDTSYKESEEDDSGPFLNEDQEEVQKKVLILENGAISDGSEQNYTVSTSQNNTTVNQDQRHLKLDITSVLEQAFAEELKAAEEAQSKIILKIGEVSYIIDPKYVQVQDMLAMEKIEKKAKNDSEAVERMINEMVSLDFNTTATQETLANNKTSDNRQEDDSQTRSSKSLERSKISYNDIKEKNKSISKLVSDPVINGTSFIHKESERIIGNNETIETEIQSKIISNLKELGVNVKDVNALLKLLEKSDSIVHEPKNSTDVFPKATNDPSSAPTLETTMRDMKYMIKILQSSSLAGNEAKIKLLVGNLKELGAHSKHIELINAALNSKGIENADGKNHILTLLRKIIGDVEDKKHNEDNTKVTLAMIKLMDEIDNVDKNNKSNIQVQKVEELLNELKNARVNSRYIERIRMVLNSKMQITEKNYNKIVQVLQGAVKSVQGIENNAQRNATMEVLINEIEEMEIRTDNSKIASLLQRLEKSKVPPEYIQQIQAALKKKDLGNANVKTKIIELLERTLINVKAEELTHDDITKGEVHSTNSQISAAMNDIMKAIEEMHNITTTTRSSIVKEVEVQLEDLRKAGVPQNYIDIFQTNLKSANADSRRNTSELVQKVLEYVETAKKQTLNSDSSAQNKNVAMNEIIETIEELKSNTNIKTIKVIIERLLTKLREARISSKYIQYIQSGLQNEENIIQVLQKVSEEIHKSEKVSSTTSKSFVKKIEDLETDYNTTEVEKTMEKIMSTIEEEKQKDFATIRELLENLKQLGIQSNLVYETLKSKDLSNVIDRKNLIKLLVKINNTYKKSKNTRPTEEPVPSTLMEMAAKSEAAMKEIKAKIEQMKNTNQQTRTSTSIDSKIESLLQNFTDRSGSSKYVQLIRTTLRNKNLGDANKFKVVQLLERALDGLSNERETITTSTLSTTTSEIPRSEIGAQFDKIVKEVETMQEETTSGEVNNALDNKIETLLQNLDEIGGNSRYTQQIRTTLNTKTLGNDDKTKIIQLLERIVRSSQTNTVTTTTTSPLKTIGLLTTTSTEMSQTTTPTTESSPMPITTTEKVPIDVISKIDTAMEQLENKIEDMQDEDLSKIKQEATVSGKTNNALDKKIETLLQNLEKIEGISRYTKQIRTTLSTKTLGNDSKTKIIQLLERVVLGSQTHKVIHTTASPLITITPPRTTRKEISQTTTPTTEPSPTTITTTAKLPIDFISKIDTAMEQLENKIKDMQDEDLSKIKQEATVSEKPNNALDKKIETLLQNLEKIEGISRYTKQIRTTLNTKTLGNDSKTKIVQLLERVVLGSQTHKVIHTTASPLITITPPRTTRKEISQTTTPTTEPSPTPITTTAKLPIDFISKIDTAMEQLENKLNGMQDRELSSKTSADLDQKIDSLLENILTLRGNSRTIQLVQTTLEKKSLSNADKGRIIQILEQALDGIPDHSKLSTTTPNTTGVVDESSKSHSKTGMEQLMVEIDKMEDTVLSIHSTEIDGKINSLLDELRQRNANSKHFELVQSILKRKSLSLTDKRKVIQLLKGAFKNVKAANVQEQPTSKSPLVENRFASDEIMSAIEIMEENGLISDNITSLETEIETVLHELEKLGVNLNHIKFIRTTLEGGGLSEANLIKMLQLLQKQLKETQEKESATKQVTIPKTAGPEPMQEVLKALKSMQVKVENSEDASKIEVLLKKLNSFGVEKKYIHLIETNLKVNSGKREDIIKLLEKVLQDKIEEKQNTIKSNENITETKDVMSTINEMKDTNYSFSVRLREILQKLLKLEMSSNYVILLQNTLKHQDLYNLTAQNEIIGVFEKVLANADNSTKAKDITNTSDMTGLNRSVLNLLLGKKIYSDTTKEDNNSENIEGDTIPLRFEILLQKLEKHGVESSYIKLLQANANSFDKSTVVTNLEKIIQGFEQTKLQNNGTNVKSSTKFTSNAGTNLGAIETIQDLMSTMDAIEDQTSIILLLQRLEKLGVNSQQLQLLNKSIKGGSLMSPDTRKKVVLILQQLLQKEIEKDSSTTNAENIQSSIAIQLESAVGNNGKEISNKTDSSANFDTKVDTIGNQHKTNTRDKSDIKTNIQTAVRSNVNGKINGEESSATSNININPSGNIQHFSNISSNLNNKKPNIATKNVGSSQNSKPKETDTTITKDKLLEIINRAQTLKLNPKLLLQKLEMLGLNKNYLTILEKIFSKIEVGSINDTVLSQNVTNSEVVNAPKETTKINAKGSVLENSQISSSTAVNNKSDEKKSDVEEATAIEQDSNKNEERLDSNSSKETMTMLNDMTTLAGLFNQQEDQLSSTQVKAQDPQKLKQILESLEEFGLDSKYIELLQNELISKGSQLSDDNIEEKKDEKTITVLNENKTNENVSVLTRIHAQEDQHININSNDNEYALNSSALSKDARISQFSDDQAKKEESHLTSFDDLKSLVEEPGDQADFEPEKVSESQENPKELNLAEQLAQLLRQNGTWEPSNAAKLNTQPSVISILNGKILADLSNESVYNASEEDDGSLVKVRVGGLSQDKSGSNTEVLKEDEIPSNVLSLLSKLESSRNEQPKIEGGQKTPKELNTKVYEIRKVIKVTTFEPADQHHEKIRRRRKGKRFVVLDRKLYEDGKQQEVKKPPEHHVLEKLSQDDRSVLESELSRIKKRQADAFFVDSLMKTGQEHTLLTFLPRPSGGQASESQVVPYLQAVFPVHEDKSRIKPLQETTTIRVTTAATHQPQLETSDEPRLQTSTRPPRGRTTTQEPTSIITQTNTNRLNTKSPKMQTNAQRRRARPTSRGSSTSTAKPSTTTPKTTKVYSRRPYQRPTTKPATVPTTERQRFVPMGTRQRQRTNSKKKEVRNYQGDGDGEHEVSKRAVIDIPVEIREEEDVANVEHYQVDADGAFHLIKKENIKTTDTTTT